MQLEDQIRIAIPSSLQGMFSAASLRQRCGAPARADSAVADRRHAAGLRISLAASQRRAIQTTLDRHHEAIAQLIRQSPPAPTEFQTTLAAPAASGLLPPVGPVAPPARLSQHGGGFGSDSRSSPVFRVAPAIEGSAGSDSDVPGAQRDLHFPITLAEV
eukprot:s2470_g6.t1